MPKLFPILAALAGLTLSGAALAAPAPLKIVARIAGPDGGWDYASYDKARGRIYVAHGQQVSAIDIATGVLTPHFAAGDHLHAVLSIPGADLILTTNSGDNTARILKDDGTLIASVPTAKDPDAAIFDPASGLVYVMGGDSGVVTFVDPKAAKAVGSITVGGALEFPQLDGLGRLFINREDKNDIAVVSLKSRKVLKFYPMPGCQAPTGLALVTGGRLISACANGVAKILDVATGKEIASLKIGARPDAVLYDAGRNVAYIPSGLSGTLSVIALTGPTNNQVVETAATAVGARTGAIDTGTGRIYLPSAQYLPPAAPGQRPQTKPGTFEVLVLDRP